MPDCFTVSQFVQLAVTFPCDISISRMEHTANGKSIMGVLMLVAAKGAMVTITARGTRADEAVAALAQLVTSRFGEPA